MKKPVRNECLNCGSKDIALTDDTDRKWCEDCQYRGNFLNWGNAHKWPPLEAKRDGIVIYALAQGQYFWQTTALLGTEERVLALFTAIEELKQAS